MKTKSKALLLSLCAVMLVCASVLGTLAYLTSTDEVTNTFTVGKVAITLDEAKVDEYGTEDTEAARVKANTYKLMPNHLYVKDPEVHVDAASEDCYLFVTIDNQITAIEDATTVADQMVAKGWKLVDKEANAYVYTDGEAGGWNAIVDNAGKDISVFDTFKIKADVNNEILNTYNGKSIVIKAYAIQAADVNGIDAAWAAVKPQP